uniref:Uncharacterized protein n=1 Tax=Anguilla anguilla TaxID=7936 RepID=A0A0E9VRH4_ANGAN
MKPPSLRGKFEIHNDQTESEPWFNISSKR